MTTKLLLKLYVTLTSFVPLSFALSTATSSSCITTTKNPLTDFDYYQNDKLPWIPEGYRTWVWKNEHKVNYVELGEASKPPILLIHGFGASVYHFRYNIPDLARDHHVFALDLLGFGGSDKPIQEYTAEVWRDQVVDFCRQVIQRPVTLCGNSLGGYTALYAATSLQDVQGCILLNSAGRFADKNEESDKPQWLQKIQTAFQRFVIRASFYYTQQPARITQILRQVYVDNTNIDDELVESIYRPSLHENAPEVFYRVISRSGNKRQVTMPDLLEQASCPLLLCWGQNDPWIGSDAADKIQELYENGPCHRVNLQAGHCPHDEAPSEVNAAIREFVKEHR
jgi:pimeloyl-ACP methyl ester carboxylesterase